VNSVTEQFLAPRNGLQLAGGGVPWIDAMRASAAQRFTKLGLPTTRDEDWKYTNLKPLAKRGFAPAARPGDADVQRDVLSAPVTGAYRLVFINGYHVPALSTPGSLPRGLTAASLAATLRDHPDAVADSLGKCLPGTVHGLTELNTAYLNDGAYIHIARDCVVEAPIELVFINGPDNGPQMAQPRNLIIAGENSKATIIERYVSRGSGGHLTNVLSELTTYAGASVEHYRLQAEHESSYHVGGLFIVQHRDSRVVSHNVAWGAAIGRTDLHVALREPGARCALNGLYLCTGRQHIDNHTHVDHRAPHCTSDEYYKGVLTGRSRAVFHGRVVVHPGANGTDARQQNKNLLLSADAEVDTKPQLEIYADDVKCSHGATVGQLDPNALFYLRTRAIDEATARSMLTAAFANDVISRLALDPVRHELEALVPEKILVSTGRDKG